MKQHRSFFLQVAVSLGTATLLSLLVSIFGFWCANRTVEANHRIQDAVEADDLLDSILSQLQQAESGQRSYSLTGDEYRLEPYIGALLGINRDIDSLQQIMGSDAEQHQLQMLRELSKQRLDYIAQSIKVRREQGLQAAVARAKLHQGNVIMVQVQQIARDLEAQIIWTLRQNQQIATTKQQQSIIAFASAVVLNMMIFSWVYYLIYCETRKRVQKEQEIYQLNNELEHRVIARTEQLNQTLQDLQKTQSQLVQQEKMSSLGQLVAGVAHEINNPVNFIHGNLNHVQEYTEDLLKIVHLYQCYNPTPIPEIQTAAEEIDLIFLQEDLPKIIDSMKVGTDRIRQIVLSLRNFSRLDQAEMKPVDIHEGIDSTLMILQNRLKDKSHHSKIKVIKEYGNLPLVECYAGQLNQVFMNLLTNAVDALEELSEKRTHQENQNNPSQITIRTSVVGEQWVQIAISDNGPGIPKEIQSRIFDPFFTTKSVGKGTGLGMSISYEIVTEKHGGSLQCLSILGEGTEFIIKIPLRQSS